MTSFVPLAIVHVTLLFVAGHSLPFFAQLPMSRFSDASVPPHALTTYSQRLINVPMLYTDGSDNQVQELANLRRYMPKRMMRQWVVPDPKSSYIRFG
ncbi:hypothetical protein AAVH_31125 [Aphelenchoides avenae]|nr:hypothetical protein AAVH_31125 [Aphelenchus avenae]